MARDRTYISVPFVPLNFRSSFDPARKDIQVSEIATEMIIFVNRVHAVLDFRHQSPEDHSPEFIAQLVHSLWDPALPRIALPVTVNLPVYFLGQDSIVNQYPVRT